MWALTTNASHLVWVVNLVVFQHMELDLLFGVLHFLRLGVCLLLTLLTPSTQTEHKMKGGLLLNVVILKGAAVLQLFARKDEALLIWRNSFLILNLSFDSLDSVGSLHLKGDGLSRECLHKDLHDSSGL